MDKQTNTDSKSSQITPEMERRMRLFANLIIDRIFEDKKNNALKFRSNSNTQQNEAKKHVNRDGNTA